MNRVNLIIFALFLTCPLAMAAQQPKRVRIAQDLALQYTRKEVPARPVASGGDATLKVIVSPAGDVVRVVPISGSSAAVRAASEALRQWKYTPYFLAGREVEFETQVTIHVPALGPHSAPARHDNSPTKSKQSYRSPDGQLTVVVAPSGVQGDESRVSIVDDRGNRLCIHDFSSADGDHGYGVDGAGWTADSRYFVFRMRSSGGHSPMYAPVMFWSRNANHFYEANDYTADQTLEITGQEDVRVSTWPALNPITITLGKLTNKQISELR